MLETMEVCVLVWSASQKSVPRVGSEMMEPRGAVVVAGVCLISVVSVDDEGSLLAAWTGCWVAVLSNGDDDIRA